MKCYIKQLQKLWNFDLIMWYTILYSKWQNDFHEVQLSTMFDCVFNVTYIILHPILI